jgi:RHS repeat-associated protein
VVRVKDLAGNQSAWVSRTLKIESVTKYYTFGSQRVAMRRGNVVYYLHGDHLGSTSLTTDSTGNILSQSRYLPYGQERWTDKTSPTDFGYTSQRIDSYIKLIQMGARWYDAELGRFISPDTIIPDLTNPQSLNRYSYANNNPIRYNDPSGHCPICIVAIFAGLIAYQYLSEPDIAYAPDDAMAASPLPPSDLPGNDSAAFQAAVLMAGGMGSADELEYNGSVNEELGATEGIGATAKGSGLTVDLFGGKTSQIPDAVNLDTIAEQGIRASATDLPFATGSVSEIIASGPRSPFLEEASRVLEPGGRIYINATKGNKFGSIPDAETLSELNLRVIQENGPLDSRFEDQVFRRTDGSVIPTEAVRTSILEKVK